jgi:uncharacterized lipoprotein YmbA
MVAGARSVILSVVVLVMFSACSSSSPVRYFSLSPIDADFKQDPDDAVMLGLGPIRMPDYINRSQIVTRGANAEMQVDEFSRWSEPLAKSLLRIVSADVDNLLQGVVVVVFPYEPFVRDQVDYRLVGDINRFEADHLGRIVLEVQWGITDVNGTVVVVPVRRNRYQTQVSTAGDPSAVVVAMNEALAQFSRDIAGKMEAELQD